MVFSFRAVMSKMTAIVASSHCRLVSSSARDLLLLLDRVLVEPQLDQEFGERRVDSVQCDV